MAKALAKKTALGNNAKITLKTPKGTRDFGPKQMAIREKVIDTITEIFKRHGAVTMDTPVFELNEILMGKYGEESSKLVYDLADQGGELCSMRYDLTVPFARYLAMNKITNLKRYQIAKVYRRDQPVMTKGRYREFFQCDFDIAGQYDLMTTEAECLKIADEVLSALEFDNYEIKINHRLLLEGIFKFCGVEPENFKTVCSSIDKLDKQPWDEIEKELINEKSINENVVKNLDNFIRLREQNLDFSNEQLFCLLKENLKLNENVDAYNMITEAIKELQLLLHYTNSFDVNEKRIVFDPSLARGLDYYTGVIYEVIIKELTSVSLPIETKISELENNNENSSFIGSIAAGGRYDKLVGMFKTIGNHKKRDNDVPCVGISFGLERLFTIIELKAAANLNTIRTSKTQVLVTGQKGMLIQRMKLCAKLWKANIPCEMTFKDKVKLLNEFQLCENQNIPWILIFGEEELNSSCVKLRNMNNREEENHPLDDIVRILQKKLNI